jgi:hypothetical protein
MKSHVFALAVQPAPGAATNDIRGIKPPVHIPYYWPWIFALLILLIMALLLYFYWRHRRQHPAPVKPAEVVPPHVRARQKLQAALSLMTDPRLFIITVSDTIRLYLEERFDLRAPERTTEEFLYELSASPALSEEQKRRLADFLQRCDLVKFARYEPALTELQQIHDVALGLVEETIPTPLLRVPPDSTDVVKTVITIV